ncbi:MAG: enoyl-CoA hydratase-related protein [Flavobacteriales bacterium]|nr:enoyl-CoA hydratase-related protein [Flavobacteriales bacterium]
MSYKNIISVKQDGVCLLTINRPDKLNALNKETIAEISHCVSTCGTNDEVKVIIITGSGEKAFVAGADISEFAHFDKENGKKLSAEGHEKLFDLVENTSKPVIAAINGFALGGGLELAMSCHIRYASENAKLGLPEVSLGVIPGYGGTQRLPRLVGKGRAMEMIFTGGMITAAEAAQYGLVNKVVPQTELISACMELAQKIMRNSPSAIAQAIRAVNAGYRHDINGFEVEIESFGNCFDSADFKEGTTAFLEKRKPQFTGK